MEKRKKKRKESLKEIYARVNREFTAADLQQYTRVEPGVPARKVLADMKKIHQRITGEKL